ncbi:hypothetical protein OSTOST_23101, partial [Ostertagia ostertagi]
MDVVFLSVELQAVLTTLSLPFTASCKRAFLSSDVVDDVCCLAIAREDGQVLTFRIPNWSTLTGTSKDNLQAYCKEVPVQQLPLQICQLGNGTSETLGDTFAAFSFVRVRPCCNNRFLMGLTLDGIFVVTDLWTFSTILEKNLRRNE